MPTKTEQQQLSSAQMLRKMSARLGKALGVGGQASFAVLKSSQTPADLFLEWAIEEAVRIDQLAKSRKAPAEVMRATQAMKRVIDIALAAEERLAKKNELGTIQRVTHPDQQQTKVISASGAGPLAKDEPEATEAPKSGLDQALSGLAAMAGIEAEEEEEPEVEEEIEAEEPEVEEETAEETTTEAVAEGEDAEKSYPIGDDGVPIDAQVSWTGDIAKDAARERKATNAAILEKAIKDGNQSVIAEFRKKAERRDGSLRRE